MALEVLYEDDFLVAVNKPYGYVVHKSWMTRNAYEILLQELRDQVDSYLYPIHRLDRKTTGVVVLSKDKSAASQLGKDFIERRVYKTYMAVVRGWLKQNNGAIDYSLTNDRGLTQQAVTRFKMLDKFEINLSSNGFPTSRYSLVKLFPETGRQHQLRKHMNHLRHPILGDRPHGCNKQNRLWLEHFDYREMMLHAQEIEFVHPISTKKLLIKAPFSSNWNKVMNILSTPINESS